MCVAVYVCVCVYYCNTLTLLFHSTLASVTGLILVYYLSVWLADDPVIITSPHDSTREVSSFIFNQIKLLLGEPLRSPNTFPILSSPYWGLTHSQLLQSASSPVHPHTNPALCYCLIYSVSLNAIIGACGRHHEGKLTNLVSQGWLGGRHISKKY